MIYKHHRSRMESTPFERLSCLKHDTSTNNRLPPVKTCQTASTEHLSAYKTKLKKLYTNHIDYIVLHEDI